MGLGGGASARSTSAALRRLVTDGRCGAAPPCGGLQGEGDCAARGPEDTPPSRSSLPAAHGSLEDGEAAGERPAVERVALPLLPCGDLTANACAAPASSPSADHSSNQKDRKEAKRNTENNHGDKEQRTD